MRLYLNLPLEYTLFTLGSIPTRYEFHETRVGSKPPAIDLGGCSSEFVASWFVQILNANQSILNLFAIETDFHPDIMSAGVSVGDFGVDFKRCRGLNLDVACGRVLGVVCIQISIFLESFVGCL